MGGDPVLAKLSPGRLELHNAESRVFGWRVAKRLNATGGCWIRYLYSS